MLGRLLQFRDYYLEQRRLQVTNDLQPPHKFLESYQPYLAQVGCGGDGARIELVFISPTTAVASYLFGHGLMGK